MLRNFYRIRAGQGLLQNHINNIDHIAPLSHRGNRVYRHIGPNDPYGLFGHPALGRPATTEQYAPPQWRFPVAVEVFPFRDAVTDWRSVALCRDTDPTLFFPVGATGAALDQIAAAKAVCLQCAARPECLEFEIGRAHV